ncbi:hypothetical protein ES707_08082 [subsurface metagenome]
MEYLDQIGKFISQVGFPVFVCLYLMFRFERTLISLDNSIKKLILLIETQRR